MPPILAVEPCGGFKHKDKRSTSIPSERPAVDLANDANTANSRANSNHPPTVIDTAFMEQTTALPTATAAAPDNIFVRENPW